jgi:hypothetical protein
MGHANMLLQLLVGESFEVVDELVLPLFGVECAQIIWDQPI